MNTYEIVVEKSAEADFSKIPAAMVTVFPWNCAYQPRTSAQVAALSDAFSVRMITDEREPRTEVETLNGPVYTDSCMEFFFMPDPERSKEYINWEFNSRGVLFLSVGTDRYDRRLIDRAGYTGLFRVETRVGDDGWELCYQIPYEFIREFFPHFEMRSGKRMRGNFYKCADLSDRPHYGCWADIRLPAPDFHSPDFFGDLILK